MVRKAALAAAAMAALAGCAAAGAGGAVPPGRAAGPFPDAAFALVLDRAALEAFLARLPAPAAERVRQDLADATLPAAIAFLGTAPTAGHRVEIQSVRVRPGGVVEVVVRHEAPPSDALVAQVLTYPVAVAPAPGERLPEGLREVRFLAPDGRIIARTRPRAGSGQRTTGVQPQQSRR